MPELSIGCEASYSGIRCSALDHPGGFLKTAHQNFIHWCLWFPRPLQLWTLQVEIERCDGNCISHITSTCKAKKKAHKCKNISRPFHFIFKCTQCKRRNQQPEKKKLETVDRETAHISTVAAAAKNEAQHLIAPFPR